MPSIWSYCDPSEKGYGIFKRNIFNELCKIGWTTHLAEAPLLEQASKPILREHFFRYATDWVLLINQSAAQLYEYLQIQNPQPFSPLKKWVWYLDDPRFFVDRPFEPTEYVFSFDETYVDSLREFKPGGYGFWPLAADMKEIGEFRPEFACDVCFVGGVIDQSARRSQLPEAMRHYVDELVTIQLQQRHLSFEELAEQHPFQTGKSISISPQVAHYLYWEANNRYRIQVLESLLDFNLRIYGNEDWEILLKDSPLRERFYGPCDPKRDLPHVFVSSKINLNIHSVQCRGSLNQRDFNAPVAGGFLLSDWAPAAGKYFIPGSEAVYWNDIYDLCAKISYYLNHPDERTPIIQQGRERVLREHTYKQRVRQMVEVLGEG